MGEKLILQLRKLLRQLARLQIPVHAAHASFFIVLAVFPALVLLLGLLRYTGLGVEHFTDLLSGFLPAGLMPYAKRLILNTYQNTTGAVLSVSALAALWSASRGIHGLLWGLQAVYGVQRTGGYLRRRLTSILYTFGFLLVLILTLVLEVFGGSLLNLLPVADTPLYRFFTDVVDLRFFLLLGLQTGLFTLLFWYLPGKCPLGYALPGALLAAAGWLVFSDLYSVYIAFADRYTSIYGSVYALALSMLWLYCCLCLVFYGAALNQFFLKKTAK